MHHIFFDRFLYYHCLEYIVSSLKQIFPLLLLKSRKVLLQQVAVHLLLFGSRLRRIFWIVLLRHYLQKKQVHCWQKNWAVNAYRQSVPKLYCSNRKTKIQNLTWKTWQHCNFSIWIFYCSAVPLTLSTTDTKIYCAPPWIIKNLIKW